MKFEETSMSLNFRENLSSMSNTIQNNLFLYTIKRFLNLCLVVKQLLIDECTELGLSVDAFDL